MEYSMRSATCPSQAEVGAGAPAFADMFPDALLLDSSGADVASLIFGIEHDLTEECQQQQQRQQRQADSSSWLSLLPAHMATAPLECNLDLPPAAHRMTSGAWHSSACMILNKQAAAAAQASAAASPSRTGSDCTAAAGGSFMQLVQDATITTAALLHVDILSPPAAAAAAPAPCSILALDRKDSAAGSSMLQCISPGSTSSPRTCSAGLLSGSEDSSLQGLGAPAALTAAGRPGSSSGGLCAAGADSAATAAAAGGGRTKRKAANLINQRGKLRQKRHEDADCTKEQLSCLYSKNAELQEKVATLRADNSTLLQRLAHATTKWQSTVVENAQLNQENGRVSAQLAQLQHQLAMAQQEVHLLRQTMQQQQQQPIMIHQQQQRCMHQQQQQQQPLVMHQHCQQQQHAAGVLEGEVWAAAGQW